MIPLYPKIQSIYKRDERGTFILGQFAKPEIEYLRNCEWEWTEKVDGTNIRIGGRTSRAQIPTFLLDALRDLSLEGKLREHFPEPELEEGEERNPYLPRVILFGEGYGARIQKGGGNYRSDSGFVLFDVKVGSWWLQREDVEKVATQLGLDVVPIVSFGTLLEAEQLVRPGLKSRWGDFEAEGLVCTPIVPLFNRQGRRIVVKLKTKDYRRLEREAEAANV